MKDYKVCAITDAGKLRDNNEDNFYCNGFYKSNIEDNSLFYDTTIEKSEYLDLAVFDGMGGASKGEEASMIAAQTLDEFISRKDYDEKYFDFNDVINFMNDNICYKAQEYDCNMGSTAVMMHVSAGKVKIANIGDSRAYLLRDGQLSQLSVDHTEANSLKNLQKELGMDYTKPEKSMKNSLTQHLGINVTEFILEPAITKEIKIKEKDIFLLCSDGLTNMVSDETIAEILIQDVALEVKRTRLKIEAMFAGGTDNITLILFEA